ncbi:hypothetical protein [Croceiramulus getboli]|nr:hypothetical protein P8624_01220 [Flavobacteriaceae bacterium YJPT1-3]
MRRVPRIKWVVLLLLMPLCVLAQRSPLQGSFANGEAAEGVHIINRTANRYTIADQEGAFEIVAKPGDTLVFSAVQYQLDALIVTPDHFQEEFIVTLQEYRNKLGEVRLGNPLSGSLERDLSKIAIAPSINYYDLGIPGFQGVHAEKIIPLHKTVKFVGLGFGIDVEALYKNLGGYYKNLHTKRQWEQENADAVAMAQTYGSTLFLERYHIPMEKIDDFLYYCMETSDIQKNYQSGNHALVLDVFNEKALVYQNQLGGKD